MWISFSHENLEKLFTDKNLEIQSLGKNKLFDFFIYYSNRRQDKTWEVLGYTLHVSNFKELFIPLGFMEGKNMLVATQR